MIKNFNPLITLSAAALGAVVFSAAAPAQAVTPAFPPPPIPSTTPTGILGGPPVTFGYNCFNGTCPSGQTSSQFQTRVYSYQATSSSPVQVLFQFFNTGPNPSSITGIFFDDTSPLSLLSLAGIYGNTTGVDFTVSNQNVPGGNRLKFDADYGAASTSPTQPNGINPGETLSLLFNIRDGFTDPFNAVITDLQDKSLRIGLQVQGLPGASDPSAQYINEEVPEPLTILGTAVALAGGAALKRRASLKASKEKAAVG